MCSVQLGNENKDSGTQMKPRECKLLRVVLFQLAFLMCSTDFFQILSKSLGLSRWKMVSLKDCRC